jgi:hypothetical protein
VYHPSGFGILRWRLRHLSSYPLYCVMREGACYSSIVVLRREARCSSSSCLLDSSVWREVRPHRQVARRIDVPPSSGYVYRSRNWEIHYIHWIRRCIMKDRAKQSSSPAGSTKSSSCSTRHDLFHQLTHPACRICFINANGEAVLL